MKKLIYIFFFQLLVSAFLSAKETEVEVRPGDKEIIESEPKKIVTTVFRVANKTSSTREFVSDVELPEDWRLITRDFPFELAANSSDVKLVSFLVPQYVLSGTYDITYRVQGKEYPSLSDSYTIHVVILPVKRLHVQVLEAPKQVIAGEEYRTSFVVSNQSNIEDVIRIDVETDSKNSAIPDCEVFRLSPSASRMVLITIKSDPEIRKPYKHQIQFKASFASDEQVEFQAAASVEIIPRISGVRDRYHRVPTSVAFYSVVQGNHDLTSGFQGEVSGEGTLDGEGSKHIRFKMKGPDIYDKSVFGLRDEYYVSHWASNYGIHLGDRYYNLSPLMEKFRYGRGAEGYFHLKRLQLGAFYQRTRWIYPRENQIASYIRYFYKKKNRIGINYLNKKRNGDSDHIVSLEGEVVPFKNTTIEFEFAAGEKEGKTQDAVLTKLISRQPKFNYTLHWIRASNDFPGYYRDTHLFSTALSLRLIDNLRMNAYILREKQNFKIDTTNYIAPVTEYYQLGLYYRVGEGTNITLDWFDKRRQDRNPEPRFDYHERLLRFGANQNIHKFSIRATAELGRTTNRLMDSAAASEKYTFSTYFKPTARQSYRGYLYYEKNARYTAQKASQFTVGLNFNLHLASRTTLYFNFQNNYSPENYYQDRNVLEVRLKQMFLDNHQVSLRSRYTLLRNSLHSKYAAVMLEYRVHFGIPVCRQGDVGIVKGHVYDLETMQAVRDLIIRINGSTAVTDKEGYFIFPSVRPGTYYLSIDKVRVGLNKITAQKTPMEIRVRAGEEMRVDLGITRSAELSGQVMVYAAVEDSSHDLRGEGSKEKSEEYYVVGNGKGNGNGHKNGISNGHKNGNGKNGSSINGNGKTKFVQDYGLSNILVEMTRNGEVQRRLTDSQGRFLFEELRPGTWVLKVYDHNLPEYHGFERDNFEVVLKPGEKEEVLVKVLPKKRRIRFLQEGGILQEQKRDEQKPKDIKKTKDGKNIKTLKEKYNLDHQTLDAK